ncbi:MAG: rod shape-determining protein MreD [Myxococcota bacterium]
MNGQRAALILLAAFALLVAQSAISVVVPLHPFVPHLLLPIVLVLAVSQDVPTTVGAGFAFVLGYMLDLFSGNRLGLQAFLLVATHLISRGAGLRLVLRGVGSQVAATFVVMLLIGGASLTLRAVFGHDAPFAVGGYELILRAIVPPALATALVAPFVVGLVTRVLPVREAKAP